MSGRSRVQGTVAAFDRATRSGNVLMDDGLRLSFGAEALQGTGLRHLRAGQRVKVDLDKAAGSQVVLRVQILTLP